MDNKRYMSRFRDTIFAILKVSTKVSRGGGTSRKQRKQRILIGIRGGEHMFKGMLRLVGHVAIVSVSIVTLPIRFFAGK